MRITWLAITFAAASLAACAESPPSRDNVADPWLGRLEVGVREAGARRDMQRDRGQGTAYFEPLGNGRSRLVVSGVVEGKGDMSFTAEGRETADGWVGDDDVALTIDREGRLRGEGVLGDRKVTLDGRVLPKRFRLTVDTELLAGNKEALPPGTRFRFDYALARDDADDTAAGDAEARKLTCRKTTMQPRHIANLGGGAMTMIMVPVCVE